VTEPTIIELMRSVIEGGRDWGLDIAERDGSLWLDRHRGRPFDPPVEFRVTDDELLGYYRRIATSSLRGDHSPWEWWMILMSTHLAETLYQLELLGGPGMICLKDTGFNGVRRQDD
jgi:hypothetical protein